MKRWSAATQRSSIRRWKNTMAWIAGREPSSPSTARWTRSTPPWPRRQLRAMRTPTARKRWFAPPQETWFASSWPSLRAFTMRMCEQWFWLTGFRFRVSVTAKNPPSPKSTWRETNMSGEKRIGRLLLSFLLAAAASNQIVWAAEKPAKLATVRIGYVSRSILDMPYIIARDRGLFREEGLEPELIFIKADQTVPEMLAGGIDF